MPKPNEVQARRAGPILPPRVEMQGTRSLVLNGQLMIYGVIDSINDPWADGESVRAVDVMASLGELNDQDTIVCRINSPGGSATEGFAIYNALRAWDKRVEVHVDAMAASVASIVAMAGDDIVMAENASMMIHDPWTVALGGSKDLRDAADELDRFKQILINIYASRTGMDPAEIASMMAAETYMSASDAVAKGFADRVDNPLQIAACEALPPSALRKLLSLPEPRAEARESRTHRPVSAAPAASPKEEASMPEVQNNGGTQTVAPPLVITDAPVPLAPRPVDEHAIRNEAVQAERKRSSEIYAAVRAAKLSTSFADDMVREGVDVPTARERIIDAWARQQDDRPDNPAGDQRPSGIVVGADAVDKWAQGAERGLMIRAGLVKADDKDRGNEFIGLTMVELARSSLSVRNVRTGSEGRMEMVGRAFTVRNSGPGLHSSSDFPQILQNVAYRAVLQGYEEVDETFPLWTGTGTASDFRPISRVDMGLFPSLSKVEEGAEYTYATIGDSGTVVQVATYGKMFAITRQAIINDDLQFFDRVPRRMGRAAKRTIGNLVYGVLNGNPTMQDGIALFHASHGNLATSSAPPSVVTLAAGMAAMQVQKDDTGIGTGGGVMPKYVLTPPNLWMPTKVAVTSANYPGDAGQVANPIRDMFTPIADSRLTGAAWYLAGDPNTTDTIEITYLDGVQEPFLDQKDGWNVDGTEMKVRLDAGVKGLHWRGLYKNAGV